MFVSTNPTQSVITQSAPCRHSPQMDMSRVGTIILAGGQGTRLSPLTMWRCKAAMNFGGRYRLIDVPISNSINSGCDKIFIITQFLSTSIHQHIFKTYRLDSFSSGFIDILSVEEKPKSNNWFQGTADAVRQNLDYLVDAPVDYFLILSGDQLYNMDFQQMLMFAQHTDADLVVASLPVTETEAKRMGILKIDEQEFIIDFQEKPQDRPSLDRLQVPAKQKEKLNINHEKNLDYLGSMGIYLFKKEALFDLLNEDPREDFGKHLIPTKVKRGRVASYVYQGYWEDIGTIRSFYDANIALTHAEPALSFYLDKIPIYTTPTCLPGTKISNSLIKNSIICEGSIVEAEEVTHSILGPRSIVHKGTTIQNSYLIGNDSFNPYFQIGKNSLIRNAIVDKHVTIGKEVQLINKNQLTHYDGDNIYIRDGIIIVPQGAKIPDGFIL